MGKTSALNDSQLGVYLDSVGDLSSTKYNIPLLKNFGHADADRLSSAVKKAIVSCASFFYSFKEKDGIPYMEEGERCEIKIPFIKVDDAKKEALTLIKPFSLGETPLCRAYLLEDKAGIHLFLDMHHLVSDGTSAKLIMDKISALYEGGEAQKEGKTLLEEALEEQSESYKNQAKKDEEYFLNKFDGINVDSNLPIDKPDEEPTYACDRLDRKLSLPYGDFDELAKKHQVTKGNLLIAAFAYCLAKFAASEEALFCTVSSGRDESIAGTSGMFVRTFPYYQKFDEEEPIGNCFRDASKQMKDGVAHSKASFASLSKNLGINTDILFTYQGRLFQGMSLLPKKDAQANIAFFVLNEGDHFKVELEYRSSLYKEGTIARFLDCYEAILNGFLKADKLSEIPLQSQADALLIDDFNKTEKEISNVDNIASLFLRQAKKTPNQTAVVYKDKKLTYQQVDELSSKLASYLHKQGIGRGDFVSLLLSRSEWMPIASLGVIKSGAAYQPLDSTYPEERLSFMVKDAGAKLLVSERSLVSKIKDYNGKILFVDEIGSLPDESFVSDIAQEDPFIILYTSGTTGTPKGVMLSHRNLVNHVNWQISLLGLSESSKYASYASFGFDANMMDTYPVLSSGATLHIIPEEIRLDLPALDDYFVTNGITHTFMTTQVGRQFALYTSSKQLKYLSLGGEKLVPLAPPEGIIVTNMYGPTECTVYNTFYRVISDSKLLPIGKAVMNTKLYVVDKHLRPLPIGASGELCIAGAGVAIGYLNRPEASGKAFVKNPFTNEKGYERMYRTGDIVRYLEDGNIEFIGRKDGQVKIRGFRIELTEVERVIRDFPGIKDCTVAAFDAPSGGKFVAAYVVSDSKIDVDSLNEFILERKPPYMVPEVTMQIDAIPLNQNSKVNRRALPKPVVKIEEDDTPLNDLQREVSKVVEEVLGAEVTSAKTLLSRYGLTSISSIRLAALLYKKYGIEFKNRELLTGGSLRLIEERIKEKENAKTLQNDGKNRVLRSIPLTFAQEGVYADCAKFPDSTQYNIPFEITFPKGIDASMLEKAIRLVVEKHPSLKVHFVEKDGETKEEEYSDFALPIITLKMDEASYANRRKDFVRPFDLDKELMRFEIIETEKGLYLLMDFHHLISDGASVDIFVRDLAFALDGKEIEGESYTYFDYASEQKLEESDEKYFAENMNVEEATRLIPDIYDKDLPHEEGNVYSKTNLAKVIELGKKLGVTPASIYLASSYLTSSRFVYEDGVGLATISSGRSNVKISNTIGMFVNTLPLTFKIDNAAEVSSFLKNVAGKFEETLLHENYPFAKTATKFDFRPSISYAYQVGVLNDYKTRFGDLKLTPLNLGIAKIPLSIFINRDENGEGYIQISYDKSLYSEAMMKHFARSIAYVSEELCSKKVLSEIGIADEQECSLLDSYNYPWDLDFDRNDTAVTLFKKRVKEHPSKLACVYQGKSFTYEELDRVTDDLSKVIYKRLLDDGCKEKEPVIAIISKRNENTFLLPLSVIKAGCAYEPLDPSYPQKRLNFMVKDASISLLLAEDSLRDVLNEYDGPTLLFSELYASKIPDVLPKQAKPESRYIMLYTSGSTGLPKGVQLEHRNLVAYAHGTAKDDYYASDCVTAAYASFGFDVNMADTFCTLLNGGTLHLIDEDMRMNLDELAAYFDEHEITQCLLTTQVGVQFVQNHPKMKSLRYLTLGGEKLPSLDPSKLSYTLNNGYGPTENCCGVSLFPVKHWEVNIPIGKPMKTIHGYILDKTNHRLPAGAAGEYCLSGPQVSRGYLNQPEKTAKSYEQSPFDEWRMYHTGDVVRYREDGNVEFVGRKDGQVKIRGFRIETKEIESTIRSFEGIKDVTVQAYNYPSGGKYLAAFVVYEGELDTSKLNAFIKAKLPAYMVPTVTMQLEKIPLTVNQKVDKKALPEPKLESRNYIAPLTKAESDFASIFSEILGVNKVSRDADFFDLGGSSINAMKVVIAANKLGYPIVYKDLFDHGILAELAAFATGENPAEVSKNLAKPAQNESFYGDGTTEIGPDGYDYSSINELLRRNTLTAFKTGEKIEIGDVLLTGATGFLGSHVLAELLADSKRKIYCLVRPKQGVNSFDRFKKVISSYHGSVFDGDLAKRVSLIEKDATDPNALSEFDVKGITVINCAASVKHFAKDDEIMRTNVGTVDNLIAYCLRSGSRLIHVSTESIMGNAKGDVPREGFKFNEGVLYAGQEIESNQYVCSKFTAEKKIYEAILQKGLKAKVMRVGNLSPRLSDGTFQSNYESNSFMKSLAAYLSLGEVPYEVMDALAEFSPIDQVAKAIMLLGRTPDECVTFMPSNNHFFHLGDVLRTLSKSHPIKMVEREEFLSTLSKALNDPSLSEKASSLLVYQSNKSESDLRLLGVESLDNEYTSQVLYRLGFVWDLTGENYIEAFAKKLRALHFFPEE